MVMDNQFSLEVVERLATLEKDHEHTKGDVEAHGKLLDSLDGKVSDLVGEVKQIRNAIYFMAVTIAANVPSLQSLVVAIKAFVVGH